jgi:hypothetical protein
LAILKGAGLILQMRKSIKSKKPKLSCDYMGKNKSIIGFRLNIFIKKRGIQMNNKPKINIPLSITVFPDTLDQLDQLVESKFYPNNRSLIFRKGVKSLLERIQIEALVTDFTQMDDPNQYIQFFQKIKEIINHV